MVEDGSSEYMNCSEYESWLCSYLIAMWHLTWTKKGNSDGCFSDFFCITQKKMKILQNSDLEDRILKLYKLVPSKTTPSIKMGWDAEKIHHIRLLVLGKIIPGKWLWTINMWIITVTRAFFCWSFSRAVELTSHIRFIWDATDSFLIRSRSQFSSYPYIYIYI